MAKEIAKKAASAALESTLLSLLPSIQESIADLRSEMKALRGDIIRIDTKVDSLRDAIDAKINSLRDEMQERFERTRDTINEVGHHVSRLDGRIEGYMEAMQMRMNLKESGSRKLKIVKGN